MGDGWQGRFFFFLVSNYLEQICFSRLYPTVCVQTVEYSLVCPSVCEDGRHFVFPSPGDGQYDGEGMK